MFHYLNPWVGYPNSLVLNPFQRVNVVCQLRRNVIGYEES